MTSETVLLGLRLVGGGLLLGFLFGLAWLVYRDLKGTAAALQNEQLTQGYLRVVRSASGAPQVGSAYPLLAVTSIGRAPANTIVLDDGFVSAEHAQLVRREKQWWLEDLDSSNGTLLNDLPLTSPAVVGPGDVIAIGDVWLAIEPGESSGLE